MRRLPFVAGLGLVTLLCTVLVAATVRDVPLPWRGALTRLAWRDLARGAYPALACARPEPGEADVPRLADRLPVTGRYVCAGADSAAGYAARLIVDEGWVVDEVRTWHVPIHRGRAVADSIARAVESASDGATRCPAPARDEAPGFGLRADRWAPADRAGFATELRADSLGDSRFAEREEWRITLHHHHRWQACPAS